MNPVTKTMPGSVITPFGFGCVSVLPIIRTHVSPVTRPCDLCGSDDLAIKQSTKFYCHRCAPIAMNLKYEYRPKGFNLKDQ